MFHDPKKARPRRDWLLVCSEPRLRKTAGGILLTESLVGVEKVDSGVARIIRIGPSEHLVRACGLEPGLRVVFREYLKYANMLPTDPEDAWEDGRPKEYFFMAIADVFFIAPEGMDVGVFSGRPQVPERVQK